MKCYAICKLFFFAVLLYGCGSTHSGQEMEESSTLVVVVHAEVETPISISTIANYHKNHKAITAKKRDTLVLEAYPTDFVYIDHRSMYTDTLLVHSGDTLFLSFSDTGLSKFLNGKAAHSFTISSYLPREREELVQKALDEKLYIKSCHQGGSDFRRFQSCFVRRKLPQGQEAKRSVLEKLAVMQAIYERDSSLLEERLENQYEDKAFLIDFCRLAYLRELSALRTYYPEFMTDYPNLEDKIIGNQRSRSYPFYLAYISAAFHHYYSPRKMKDKLALLGVYDSLPTRFDDDTVIKYMRVHCLREMALAKLPSDDVKYYYSDFVSQYADSNLVTLVLEEYAWNEVKSADLLLADVHGKQLSLAKLLEKYKGKVLYVDFWASWCAPCRASMVAAKGTREQFRDSDVIFIYLAYNDKVLEWKEASLSEKLDDVADNYLIINPKTADFVKDIKLTSIPRYLIYDKSGKLIHQDAPGPHEVAMILTNML